jgi:hypothetical protein
MGALFNPPKPPDTSAATATLAATQQKQADAAAKRDAELTEQEEARKRAIAGGQRGRISLLGPGGEVGVRNDLKSTLGG